MSSCKAMPNNLNNNSDNSNLLSSSIISNSDNSNLLNNNSDNLNLLNNKSDNNSNLLNNKLKLLNNKSNSNLETFTNTKSSIICTIFGIGIALYLSYKCNNKYTNLHPLTIIFNLIVPLCCPYCYIFYILLYSVSNNMSCSK